MFETKVVEKIKTHISYAVTSQPHPPLENRAVYKIRCEKYFRAGHATDDYGLCALHAGYLKLKTHTQNI